MKLLAALAIAALLAGACRPAGRDEPDELPREVPTYDGADFYAPPDPLPGGQPGAAIWRQELWAPEGVQAYRILYLSTSIDGVPIAVSGMVAAPGTPALDMPVVAIAPGTVGLADQCAPSRAGLPADAARLAGDGWIVAVTDYEGLGPPGDHPYLVGESQARAVLDVARAARHVFAVQDRRVAVLGYSQGGHAALFAGQAAGRYAPELDVVGVVGAAGPLLDGPLPGEGTSGQVGFAGMIAVAWAATYPDLELDAVLTPRGSELVEGLQDLCTFEILARLSGEPFDALVDRRVLAEDPWLSRRRENSPGHTPVDVPVLLVYGGRDLLVPPETGRELLQRICSQGGLASLQIYPGDDHASLYAAAMPDARAWIEARLAGRPAPDDCPV